MKWLKKIFGKKEKPKDETPLLPIKDEEQPLSVPDEKWKCTEHNQDEWACSKHGDEFFHIKNYDWDKLPRAENVVESVQPEEPIAPTLERQDEIIPEITKEEKKWVDSEVEKLNDVGLFKKKSKKKDKFNDDASKPKGRNFLM